MSVVIVIAECRLVLASLPPMKARFWDKVAWLLAAVVGAWLLAWAYVNNWSGDHPAAWTFAFKRAHDPIWNALPSLNIPPALLLVSGLLGLALYLLPTWIASTRRAAHFGSIIGINIFLGWTVLGWLAALGWALTDRGSQR